MVSSPAPSQAAPFVSCGRSKRERWSAESPNSSSSGGSPRSFRDVVISSHESCVAPSVAGGGGPPAMDVGASPLAALAAPAVATKRPPPTASWAPRISLLRRDRPGRRGAAFSSGAAREDQEGWQEARSRGARRRQRRAARPPRRPVPADLFGRCFNCFSTSHTAALCR